MSTLLAKWLADPSHANARKITEYAKRHPMVECLLDPLELGLVAAALTQSSKKEGKR